MFSSTVLPAPSPYHLIHELAPRKCQCITSFVSYPVLIPAVLHTGTLKAKMGKNGAGNNSWLLVKVYV